MEDKKDCVLVQGRRAASSASTVLVALTGAVFGIFLLVKCTRAGRTSSGGRAAHTKAEV